MTRKVDVNKFIVKDLRAILFDENQDFKEIIGHWLEDDAEVYICVAAIQAYYAGAERVVTELNRQADREVLEAQTKAIRKLMKMTDIDQ